MHRFPLLEKVEILAFILPRNFPAVLIIFPGRGTPPSPYCGAGQGIPPSPRGRFPAGWGVHPWGAISVKENVGIVKEERDQIMSWFSIRFTQFSQQDVKNDWLIVAVDPQLLQSYFVYTSISQNKVCFHKFTWRKPHNSVKNNKSITITQFYFSYIPSLNVCFCYWCMFSCFHTFLSWPTCSFNCCF